jgi:DNA-binding response OmpR family regulator
MKKYKVLYVEDEKKIRKNHTLYLKDNFDVDIVEAENGLDGYASYLKCKPDIIITDITMPKMSGLEMIEKIREEDKDVKIIVFSAYNDQEKLLQAIPLNLIEYKIKPIKRRDMKEVMIKVLKCLEDDSLFYFDTHSYFNQETEELKINESVVKLSHNELQLLKYLVIQQSSIVSAIDIFNYIWDFTKEYSVDYVRTLVKKLRKKLPQDSIENIYGGGYRLKKKGGDNLILPIS